MFKHVLQSTLFGNKKTFMTVINEGKRLRKFSTNLPTHHQQQQSMKLDGVKDIIVVSSGKGGVGKSTVATNLALALSSFCQKSVGLLDADIYGPSIHRMMNLSGKPTINEENRKFVPKSNYGVKTMSMGFLVQEDAPTIWRGPMVMSAVDQLLRQVDWGELDVLVIDLPPGTGDAQLSICQRVQLSGAVIVSTPQDIALIDVKRGVNMFRRLEVPILGVVENMSYFKCSNCGHEEHIFGHDGARKTAQEMGLNFIGEIPLHVQIRETSDAGRPVVISDPDSERAASFVRIARNVLNELDKHQSSGPKITIED